VHAFLDAERGRGNHVERVVESGAGRVTLSFEVLPDEVITFAISGRILRMVRSPVKSDSLRQLVSRFTRSVQGGASSVDHVSEQALYVALVAPVLPEILATKELVIVPDGPLGMLPFAALRGKDGRYLIQDVLVSYASQVGEEPKKKRDVNAGAMTIVGNPSFDAALFPELARLRGADRETQAVRKVRPQAELIEGDSATKPAVMTALRRSAVLHFAGHARRVDRAPSLSHLVLARATGGLETNALSAAEIATTDLRNLSLVILSSCGTSQRASFRNEGQSGLSTAFLDAGAGAVISSLWEADDEGTARLMEAVHRQLASGKNATEALQQAQVEMIQSGTQSPRVWSAFRIERQ
jgi:CHAT domain-containing protein